MIPDLKSPSQTIGRYRWTICGLLFFATTINYLDRQVIGLLKPFLESDLGIGEAQYGYIITAFTAAYAISLLVAGRLIDWIGTKIGYAFSLVGWSIAAMAHALATTPFGFGVARAFLGIFEAGNFPAAIKTVAEWFPKKERALATGIFNSGASIGAVFAPLLVPLIARAWGWQWAFILTGMIGFIWLVLWFIFYEVPEKQKRLSEKEFIYILSDNEKEDKTGVPWLRLLSYRQTWAFFIGKFLTDPVWWFYLFWIPGWIAKVQGVDPKIFSRFGLPIAIIYGAATVGGISGGWISSFLIRKGWILNKARSTSMLLFAFLVVPVVFIQFKGVSFWGAIALISLAVSAHQAWSANIFTTVSDMFPKKAVASVTGIGGMAGAASGALFAAFTGNLLAFWEKQGHIQTGYTILFGIAGSAYLIAWIAMRLIAPGMKKVDLSEE
jgi:MFS transporter, ACS family, hexuronate transporter